jgi:hypothetical protein
MEPRIAAHLLASNRQFLLQYLAAQPMQSNAPAANPHASAAPAALPQPASIQASERAA